MIPRFSKMSNPRLTQVSKPPHPDVSTANFQLGHLPKVTVKKCVPASPRPPRPAVPQPSTVKRYQKARPIATQRLWLLTVEFLTLGRAIARVAALNARKRFLEIRTTTCARRTVADSADLARRVRFVARIGSAALGLMGVVPAKHLGHCCPIVCCIRAEVGPRLSVGSALKGGKLPVGFAGKVARVR
jgi:hypothetical protein